MVSTSWALDKRAEAIDAYIFLDSSASMAPVIAAAEDWLCTSVVEGILQEGDSLTLWSFSDRPTRLLKLTIGAADTREAIKKTIREIKTDSAQANYVLALREASKAEATRPNRKAIAYVLFASTLADSPPRNGELSQLLRFSRMEAHPGWKALVVGVGDIRSRAQAAAQSYLSDQSRGKGQ